MVGVLFVQKPSRDEPVMRVEDASISVTSVIMQSYVWCKHHSGLFANKHTSIFFLMVDVD